MSSHKKLLAAAALFLLSFLVLAIYWYVQNGPYTGLSHPARQDDPRSEKQYYEANLEKAKVLRDQWRSWAVNHKALLAGMAHARPDDRATLMRVYDALPTTVAGGHRAGITHADLHSDDVHFTWQPVAKVRLNAVADPRREAELVRSQAWVANRLSEMFDKHRDIEISRSANPGRTHITLWASGRVTESTYRRQNVPGQPVFVEGEPREIYPPFDFVR